MRKLDNAVTSPKLFAITKTWLTNIVSDSLHHIDGFELFHKVRNSHGGGGTLCVSTNTFTSFIIHIKTVLCELLCVDNYVRSNTNSSPICVCCIVFYRPPHCKIDEMIEFCNVLKSLMCADKYMPIVGDFNLPYINWQTTLQIRMLYMNCLRPQHYN